MIQKSTPSRIFNLGGTYTTLPNKSLALLSDAITLGMFAIFISKPKDWRINKDNVCKDLNIKPRQYTQGIKSLKSVDLCREFCVYKDGKLNGRELIVVSQPTDWDDAQNQIIEFEQDNNVKLHLVEHKKDDEALQGNAKTEGSLFSGSVKQSPLKTDPTENATTAIYSKQTTEQEKTKEAAAIGQPSQESEVLGETQNQPAAAIPCAKAQNAKAEATAQDGVIAERLTTTQYQYAVQLATELNSANPSLGVTAQDIEALRVPATKKPTQNSAHLAASNLFASVKNFCYFEYAPAKSGVGIDTPFLRRGISLSSVMVGCFGQPLRLAVSLCSGSVNPLWPATISLTPSGGSRENLIHRGTAMINSWCSSLSDVCRQVSNSFHGLILEKGAMT